MLELNCANTPSSLALLFFNDDNKFSLSFLRSPLMTELKNSHSHNQHLQYIIASLTASNHALSECPTGKEDMLLYHQRFLTHLLWMSCQAFKSKCILPILLFLILVLLSSIIATSSSLVFPPSPWPLHCQFWIAHFRAKFVLFHFSYTLFLGHETYLAECIKRKWNWRSKIQIWLLHWCCWLEDGSFHLFATNHCWHLPDFNCHFTIRDVEPM